MLIIVFDVAVNLLMDALTDKTIGISTDIRIDALVDVNVNTFVVLMTTFGFAMPGTTAKNFRC